MATSPADVVNHIPPLGCLSSAASLPGLSLLTGGGGGGGGGGAVAAATGAVAGGSSKGTHPAGAKESAAAAALMSARKNLPQLISLARKWWLVLHRRTGTQCPVPGARLTLHNWFWNTKLTFKPGITSRFKY